MLELNKVYNMDALEFLKLLDDNSVDSIVTDPPYGISFMSKKWDYDIPNIKTFKEMLRVLKPGAHILCACGTRTQHRMACNIEDAGFEIRDVVSWIYGSGFPKSLNVGKAIDKIGGQSISWFGKWLREWRKENNVSQKEIAKLFPSKTGKLTGCVANWELGLNIPTAEQFTKMVKAFNLPFNSIKEAEREVIGKQKYTVPKEVYNIGENKSGERDESLITAPATPEAQKYEGWGTALKPACEFFTLARKPLLEKTVAQNVLKWGTGGINIDGCRVAFKGEDDIKRAKTGFKTDGSTQGKGNWCMTMKSIGNVHNPDKGRFPANLIHDGSNEVLAGFPETGASKSGGVAGWQKGGYVGGKYEAINRTGYNEPPGSASRFFYCAKASKSERNKGLEGFEEKRGGMRNSSGRVVGGQRSLNTGNAYLENRMTKNNHPTVKPVKLIRYLIRLITPINGLTTDPFCGSGTHGVSATLENMNYLNNDMTPEYCKIAEARIARAKKEMTEKRNQYKQLKLF